MFALSRKLSVVVIDDDDETEVVGQALSRHHSNIPYRHKTSATPRTLHATNPQGKWQPMPSHPSIHDHPSSRMNGVPNFVGGSWNSPNSPNRYETSPSFRKPVDRSPQYTTNSFHLDKKRLRPSSESSRDMSQPTKGLVNNPIEIIDDVDIDPRHFMDSGILFRNGPDQNNMGNFFQGHVMEKRGHRTGQASPSGSFGRLPTDDDDIIEIDYLEQEEYLDTQDSNPENAQNSQHNSSNTPVFPRRNPTITSPLHTILEYTHKDLFLRPNKTVELQDGDFLRIKDIILNPQMNEVKLRGHRLQRVKDLNGMLEKKLNEVVLFYEVDLDDPREPDEQAAIEVPLSEVSRMRLARLTNQKFPEGRNMDPSQFASKDDAARDGGLTARWKYTAIYTSTSERSKNNFKERTLERIKFQDANPQFAVPESAQRAEWRGETISGGSHRPTLDPKQEDWQRGFTGNNPIRMPSNTTAASSRGAQYQSLIFLPVDPAKRKLNSEFSPSLKKRQIRNDAVEENRSQLARSSLHINRSYHNNPPIVIDLCDDDEEPVTTNTASIPLEIDPFSSGLATPPSAGAIQTAIISQPHDPSTRLPGQKYTYGDAFCGGGGATRGAVMAGLRVKWGFDFFEHACATWRANFPSATLYQLEANAFVQAAKTAESRGFPDVMKVDILHLSPPCQFFSPAHTVDGVMDETNVASLFGVQSVIEVSKARVVTLEQTFGIAGPRFRFYFNAVIQMFTIHNFSVRWAVVPLAQWGLPQRRHRLIIIAACPGETLPRMPIPTHSNNPSSGLKPYLSVSSALNSVPPSAPNHNPSSLLFAPHRQMRPYDASQILPRAMTTHGGQNYHPSGKRGLTLREYAALQGFPTCHEFRGSHIKRQIGNAVPPSVAKVLFESIRRDLEKADGIAEGPEIIE